MYIARNSTETEVVKVIQAKLKQMGFYSGLIDGDFGSGTERAVMTYQKQLGLKPDGIIGNWTGEKLGLTNKTNVPMPSQFQAEKNNRIVVLSAGHSNVDPGAVNGKVTEAAIALETRNGVAKILRARGITVLTDGGEQENQPLNKAVTLVKHGMTAIEFHLNGAVNKSARGVEALSQPKDKAFSQKLCIAVSGVLNSPLRGSDAGWKSESSGQHTRLAFVSAGGIILESFFISNDEELAKYRANADKLFLAIADVIDAHI